MERRERTPSSHRELRASSARHFPNFSLEHGRVLTPMAEHPADALDGYVGTMDDALATGSEALRDHRWEEAVEALETAASLDPDDMTARNLLAIAHYRAGNYELAAHLFDVLAQAHPERPTHKLNLALAWLRAGDLEAARPAFEDLLSKWPELVVSSGLDRAWSEVEGSQNLRAATESPPAQQSHRAVTAVPPGAVPEPYNVPAELAPRSAALRPSNVPPSFVASVHRQGLMMFPSPLPANHTITPPPSYLDSPSVPPSHAHVGTLLEAALSSLVVVPASDATTTHPTGLVFVPLNDGPHADPETCGIAVRATAVHALAGDVFTRLFSVLADDDKPFLRVHAETFVHAVGQGHVVLAPQEGRYLLAFRMSGDVTFVREDFLSGYERRLSCAIGSFRLAKKRSMSMVRLIGEGILVLDLPRRFVSYDVTEAGSLTVRDDTLLGWVGRIVTEPLDGAIPSGAGGGLLRLAGEGTVLVLPPTRPAPSSTGEDG